ncbi:MAG: hypothetical protein RLO04_02170, partial [Limnobacter sp.]|uniref:hypothetical protein n=1 Tax=Limnobacter sp. TaxID=2003368 RepID=UPI0032F04361
MDVKATSIDQTQTGAVDVQNATTLTANTVALNNAGNDFKGQVNLAISGNTNLRDINDLVVTGDVKDAALHGDKLLINGLRATGDLALKANAVDQNPDLPNAVTVQGATRIEALAENTGNFNLNNSGNDFVGTVDLVDVGVATLFDKNSLFVEGRAGVLTLTADHVAQQQGDKLEVEQTARINAASVLLSNPENNFKGLVDLNVSEMATLHDANTLRMAGKANDALLNAVRIEIDGVLDVTENLTLTASEITQNAAIIVGGETGINGTESAVLGNADNDFVGAVHLKNTANAVLRDKNKITVAGNAGSLTVNAPSVTSGEVVLGDLTANSLTVSAVEVSQINSTLAEKVVVEGVSILNAGKVVLQNEGNDFKGQVNLAISGNTNLRDANTLTVAGTSATANLNAADIAVNGLTTTGNLNIAATNTAALNNV